ncbi:MAG: ABC transporter substrate-binding protein, partial [Desulfobulbaceae bacterium]|nr:ABC transporter substrate-binding protein [Desulfobulbaceae bacterium]
MLPIKYFAAFSLLAVYFISFAPSSHAAEAIKIGVAGPHSGDLASYGMPTVNGASLVIDRINKQGGVNGHPLELLVEDDACKPEIAVNTATKLVAEGVKVVIGHICSGATKAALPIYKEAGVLV